MSTETTIPDDVKAIAVCFFQWWWNQPGSNTEDGFDQWAEGPGASVLSCLTSRPAEAAEWMPIETAPKDGTHFLAILHRKAGRDMDDRWMPAFSEVREIWFKLYTQMGLELFWHAGDPYDSPDGMAPDHFGIDVPIAWMPMPKLKSCVSVKAIAHPTRPVAGKAYDDEIAARALNAWDRWAFPRNKTVGSDVFVAGYLARDAETPADDPATRYAEAVTDREKPRLKSSGLNLSDPEAANHPQSVPPAAVP